MDQRNTILTVSFQPADGVQPFVEVDLRSLIGFPLAGRRGQLRFLMKLVFKAPDNYRQAQSVIGLWADVQVSRQGNPQQLNLNRASARDLVFFDPDGSALPHSDPWTREARCLVLDLDFRQLDEIEQIREGEKLVFSVSLDGIAYHNGKISKLSSSQDLMYPVAASDWQQILSNLNYGTFANVEIPLTFANGLDDHVRKAAVALQEALSAFRRGEYEEAVADCRPGIEALIEADKGKFPQKPGGQEAGKDERFYRVRQSLLPLAHLAHHPNDPASTGDASRCPARWERVDAEAVIRLLASLAAQRMER
jgi:hypothetical protein